MGASKSKPYAKEAARTVLARRQQLAQAESEVLATQQQHAPKVNEAPTAATVNAVAQEATSSSPSTQPQTPPAPPQQQFSNGYNNYETLNPEILKEVSKWAVKKTEGKNQAQPVSNPVKSTTQIRFELDGGNKDEKDANAVPKGKLTEMQLHEFFKTLRDNNTVSAAVLASTFAINEEVASNLMKTARLPVIVRDESDPDSSIAV